MNNTISVIIPIFNVAPYIRECLQSIQYQTYRNLEVMLVNDGSTDESGAICDSFAESDDRFTLIHKSNGGVSSARNTGIERATGRYLAFVDPDDYIPLDFYEILLSDLKTTGSDLAVSGVEIISEQGKKTLVGGSFMGRRVVFHSNAAVVDGILDNRIACESWNKLFKRELWGNARYPLDLTLGEDMSTVPGVCARARKAVYNPLAIYFYRQREKSLLHGTVTEKRFHEDLRGSEIMRQQLLAYAPDKEIGIDLLKFYYDMSCYKQFVNSAKYTGEEDVIKGSTLHRLFSHIREANSADMQGVNKND